MSEPNLHHKAKYGKIPSYRLKNVKGHKFLFLKSELEALMKYSWMDDGQNFADLFKSNLFLRAIFEELVLSQSIMKDLTEIETKVIRDVLISRKTYDHIGKEVGFSRERIRQIFQQACKRIYYRVKLFPNQVNTLESLAKENSRLHFENNTLRKMTKQTLSSVDDKKIDILSTPIKDIAFSERVRKTFDNGEIYTLADLVNYSRADLSKFRNFGANSLKEVEDFLHKHGLKLTKDKLPIK